MQNKTDHKDLMQQIDKECLVDNSVNIDYPPVALSIGKKYIRTKDGGEMLPLALGTYGNFSFVQSPPKTKKTFFISLLSSVYISGQNNFGGDIRGHRTNQCLIHIDTEQGFWHSQRTFKRAIDMSNMDGSQCYYTYALRQIGFKQRIDFIEYLLKDKVKNKGLLIIDGIADLVSDVNNLEEQKSKLNPSNWQYFNCMTAGFKKDVGDHHELGWDNMTEEYYSNLKDMSDKEIENFLKENPVEFDNGFIRHSYHRACAMIGRLINGGKYIPFYMKKEQIYNEPRKKDGIQRRFPLFNRIKCLKLVDELKIPRGEFTICQSGILALMGIRKNSDLDVVISSKLKNKIKEIPSGVEIMSNRGKFRVFGCKDDDDFVYNFSVNINCI
mgnify:CR=1 FL=1